MSFQYRNPDFIVAPGVTGVPNDYDSDTFPAYHQCNRYRLGECHCEHRCHPDFEQRCFGYFAYDRNGDRRF